MVVDRGPRDRSAAGRPQSWEGSPDARARPGRRELALALYRGDVVGLGIRVVARPDDSIAPRGPLIVGGGLTASAGNGDPGPPPGSAARGDRDASERDRAPARHDGDTSRPSAIRR